MKSSLTLLRAAPALAMAALIAGCATPDPDRRGIYAPASTNAAAPYILQTNEVPGEFFTTELAAPSKSFATREDVKKFSDGTASSYLLGPGDRFAFVVRGRTDISREDIVVSPDGEVALPRVGILKVSGQTLAQVTETVRDKLRAFYDEPEVTLVMKEFNNNKVFVLGRVANPGAVHFKGTGTLLEALALAGGLPADTAKSFLTRCMIVRGNELVVWIDLRDLLESGNMALNARLQNNDVVFIPQSEDELAYIMGAVARPGVMVLRSQMTLLDAVMTSGGATRDADPEHIFLVRTKDGKGVVEQISLKDMVARGDLRRNYVLRDGDIVYIAETGMARFNYFMTQLLPTMRVIDFSISNLESFGVMQELRNKLWGQEGYVPSVTTF